MGLVEWEEHLRSARSRCFRFLSSRVSSREHGVYQIDKNVDDCRGRSPAGSDLADHGHAGVLAGVADAGVCQARIELGMSRIGIVAPLLLTRHL